MSSQPTQQSHSAMRDAVFRAAESHTSATAATNALVNPLVRKVPVYALPSDKATNAETVRAFHLFLIVCGTSENEERLAWQSYLATIVSACFPVMKAGILKNPMFQEIILSSATVKQLEEWYDAYGAASDSDVPEALASASRDTVEQTMFGLTLPSGSPRYDINMGDVIDMASIYGHVSIVLFLAGKTITDTNRAAITQKRPGAIERKYFNGRIVGSLQGSLRLSNVAHEQIHAAFVALSHLRKEVFTQVALFNTVSGDPTVEVAATTTRLMRYSGMQQAVMIDNFLTAHEEAFKIPILLSSIQAYTASMRDLMAAPVEQRPYYKLIHGDTTRAFNRNDLTNILVVAVMEARETNPTMQQYAIPPNHQLIMDKYYQALSFLGDE